MPLKPFGKDILKPYGKKEVLLYYGIVAEKLRKYLKGKEIASKVWLPKFFFIKRGSKEKPLYIDDFKEVTPEFLELRKLSLKDAKPKLSEKQALLWSYFVPRKYADLFYATNNEGAGKPIDRLFFDIDRGEVPAEKAREITFLFCEVLKSSEELEKLLGEIEPFVMWTGNSFHVYLFIKPRPQSFYERYIQFSKNSPLESITGRLIEQVRKQTDIKVIGGHDRVKGHINIDPSQTPSGKLCRAPFSLHMRDWQTVDGVAIPVALKDLKKKGLTEKLKKYDANRVVRELDSLAKLMPKL